MKSLNVIHINYKPVTDKKLFPIKIAFGSPQFTVLRDNINTHIEERENLGYRYKQNIERYQQLTTMIRNLANLVYFPRRPKPEVPEAGPDVPFVMPGKEEAMNKKKGKKAKVKPKPAPAAGLFDEQKPLL